MKIAIKKTQKAALAVPQYALHGTAVGLETLETGLRKTADGVGYLKDRAYQGSDYFKAVRADMEAELELHRVSLYSELEDLNGVDVTKAGASSKDALRLVAAAQRLKQQNQVLLESLQEREQRIELLTMGKRKASKAAKDLAARTAEQRAQDTRDYADKLEADMNVSHGGGLKLKKLCMTGDAPQQTGTTKLAV